MTTSLGGYQGVRASTGTNPFKGTGHKQITSPAFTPEQMQLFQQLFSQTGPESFLSKLSGGDQSQFEQLEAPALKQFGQLQGGIASRFSGMGSGARRSSGFQNATNQATSDFAQQLQSQRLGLQRDALHDLLGLSSNLLQQRPYEQYILPKKKSFLQELLIGVAPGLGMLGGGAASGGLTRGAASGGLTNSGGLTKLLSLLGI